MLKSTVLEFMRLLEDQADNKIQNLETHFTIFIIFRILYSPNFISEQLLARNHYWFIWSSICCILVA